jgi:quercetin dioxygenase-like cupin family protein
MTSKKTRADERARESDGRLPDFGRRPVLKALGAGAVLSAGGGIGAAAADEHLNGDDESEAQEAEVDEPDGFNVDILQGHVPFPDELAATFSLSFTGTGDEDDGPPIGAHEHLDDDSTMVVAEVSWEPGGTSGWHRHPGVVLVSMVEGAVELTWERDCVPRTYAAGEGFFDPGVIHNADNVSGEESARAYAVFLGIPDGEPATIWVEPVEC